MKTLFPEGRLPLADVPSAVEACVPEEAVAALRNLLSQFELDARLLPSLKAALRSLEQASGHLRACVAVAERLDEGSL
jgi:hypothetical protein